MKKKLVCLILAAVMVLAIVSSVFAAEVTANGTCGDNLTWVLTEGGTLTISGTGEMDDYSWENAAPWKHKSIISVVIESGVTGISANAFEGCESLTSITIPESVTDIGWWAFSDCANLTRIDVAAGNEQYTSLDGVLFDKDKTVLIQYPIGRSETKYIIPDGVTDIRESVFEGCESLTSITIPDSVISISSKAFRCCANLTGITIPDSVIEIGWEAFYGCTSLTSIEISDNVTYIGDGVFFGTAYYNDETNWENGALYINNALIEANRAVSGDYSIKNETICIADYAFKGCSSLTSIIIPDSVICIGWQAFSDCGSLTRIDVATENIQYTSLDGVLFDKDKTVLIQYPVGKDETKYIIPASVTDISESAFEGCTSLTSLIIPNSVRRIGDGAFSYCHSLTSITVPDGVTSIGQWAFEGCESVTSITIPDSVADIGDGAFSNCISLTRIDVTAGNEQYTSLDGVLFDKDKTVLIQYPIRKSETKYIIPDGVTSIGDYAFEGHTSLISITIPDSVTNIGWYAFEGCTSLTRIDVAAGNEQYTSLDGVLFDKDKTVLMQYPIGKSETKYTIPDGVTSIGDYAFGDCTSLASITIPDSVTDIGDGAFCDCRSMTSIAISNRVTSIGDYAFNNCTSLASITIPDSVIDVGDGAFSVCDGLTRIDVTAENEQYTSLDGVLFDKDKTVLIQYPIGRSETKYTVPNGVTSIEESAFDGCTSLTNITIPESVKSIESHAFSCCEKLSDVYYSGSEKQWKLISIEDYNDSLKNATIHFNYITSKPEIVSASAKTENGTVKVTVETKDLSAENKLIAVCYGAGEEYIAAKETDTSGNSEFDAEGVKTVKVFLWESLESMKPLCEAKVIEIK